QLWATTLSEIGRYWEAKSDVSTTTEILGGKTTVSIDLVDYDAARFGIPYLTFISPMPDGSPHAKITVNYPTTQILNSDSDTVRVVDANAIYTVYLDPASTTTVEIDGAATAYTGGVDINKPILSIDSTAPADPNSGAMVTITATAVSTDDIYTVNLIYQNGSKARDSRVMTYNPSGYWETQVGPFAEGDSVSYYVSVTDNSGRREVSADKNFSVALGPDTTLPQWQNQGQNSSTPPAGSSVHLYADGMDDRALRYATLATDETGSWEKKTAAYGSPMSLGDLEGTWVVSDFTWSNPSISWGTTVSWRIYYEDAAGNETATDIMSFTLQEPDLEDPNYLDPSHSSELIDTPTELSLKWTDNVALDEYIFSFDNGTGTFVDDTPVKFTPIDGWWDSDWQYRKAIDIDNTSGSQALTNHAVQISIDTAAAIAAAKMNPYGGDIRFIDPDEPSELDFWIESGLNTSNTRIWIEIPGIDAGSVKTVYMYYGSSNHRVPQSNGEDTFSVFDDFGGRGWEEFKYINNPVMGPGSSAGGSGVFSSVMRESETLWRMYASYDSDNRDIGLSTSLDGVDWIHQGVVLRKGGSGEWDSDNIWCPAVWEENGTYYMLYSARGPAGIAMGLATSTDGVTFTKYAGNPVFEDPDWAAGDTEGPCFSALKEDGVYYVMYNTLGGHRQSSIVSSTDLTTWTRVYDYPRFAGGATTADWNY
ncbi:MAG: DUF2341 domain-containing protein, partial [Planctomycetota bacterium]